MNWLASLYAEQTTPNDIIVFLFLGTLFTLSIAVAAYSIILVVVWQLRYKDEYELKVLLLPTLKNIRANLGDYVLATFTALLLLFTVSAKHDVVDQVLNGDLTEIDHVTASSAFPFQDLTPASGQQDETEIEKVVAWAKGQADETLSIKAADMILPLLKNNFTEGANIITRALVEKLEISQSAVKVQRWILALAVGLLIGYVLWFGWRRWYRIDNQEKTLKYADVIKRLSAPAVCIPLVLISALELGDPEHLEASAMAAMAAQEEPDTSLSLAVDQLARKTLGPPLYRRGDEESRVTGLIDEQLAQLESHQAQLQDHDRAISALVADMTKLQQHISTLDALVPRVSSLESQMDAIAGRIDGVDNLADELAGLQQEVRVLERRVGERINSAVSLANRAMSATGTLAARVSPVEQDVRRLKAAAGKTKKGLLLVRDVSGGGGNYSVRDNTGRRVPGATGSLIGVHLLEPGIYTAFGRSNQSVAVRISSDSAGVAVIPRTASFSTVPPAPSGITVD